MESEITKIFTVNNGPNFAFNVLDEGLQPQHRARFIRPGKPIENGYVETFNVRFTR